jgi:uncharacterized protein with HEPN domain
VSRHDTQRLHDIQAALAAIDAHLRRGDLSDGLVFDAVRARLIEIGEAVKGISTDLLATEPEIPWTQIAGMRDQLAHRYFDTSHAILTATVHHDLPELATAVRRLLDRTTPDVPTREASAPNPELLDPMSDQHTTENRVDHELNLGQRQAPDG